MFHKKLNLAEAQAQMVKKQLADRAITDARILKAMGEIPRHYFVDEDLWEHAYRDGPLPIGLGQTISQPYIVAYMTQALQLPTEENLTVLEIGTGSGYQAAILSCLATQVYSIERLEPLAVEARQRLLALNIHNVEIRVDDGGYGWPEHAPYDGIIVTAAAPEIPAPLIPQLKEGAALVLPVGPRYQQELYRLRRHEKRIVKEKLAPVAFVPLLGEHGWGEDEM